MLDLREAAKERDSLNGASNLREGVVEMQAITSNLIGDFWKSRWQWLLDGTIPVVSK